MNLANRLSVIAAAVFVIASVVLIPWPDVAQQWLASETGLVELATVVFALWGAVLALRIVLDSGLLPNRLLAVWFAIFVLGLIFLAGEEASWGQSWFQWQTPEEYAAINQQQETNIHNLHSWTESVPKTLLVLAALFGGVIWPIVARRRGIGPTLPGVLGWLWPSAAIWPAAALTIASRIGERIFVWTDFEDLAYAQYDALRECIELFGVLYVLAYLMNVRARMVTKAA